MRSACWPLMSVTETVTEWVPREGGMPEIVEPEAESHEGRVTVHV